MIKMQAYLRIFFIKKQGSFGSCLTTIVLKKTFQRHLKKYIFADHLVKFYSQRRWSYQGGLIPSQDELQRMEDPRMDQIATLFDPILQV